MKELSNAEAALLGLLSEKARHPYQIEQEVKFRDMRFWTELSMSSIYKLLRKLEKNGLVSCTNEISEQNRLRKLYTITADGTKTLKDKLESLLSIPEHSRWQVDIGTYNCNLLSAKKVVSSLGKYKKELQNKADGYKDLLQFLKDEGCPEYRYGVSTRPVFLLNAEIEWVDSFIKLLSKDKKGEIL